jgi:hypothetical protein
LDGARFHADGAVAHRVGKRQAFERERDSALPIDVFRAVARRRRYAPTGAIPLRELGTAAECSDGERPREQLRERSNQNYDSL